MEFRQPTKVGMWRGHFRRSPTNWCSHPVTGFILAGDRFRILTFAEVGEETEEMPAPLPEKKPRKKPEKKKKPEGGKI
jgi:hypothetical protein